MNFILKRDDFCKDGVFGALYDEENKICFHTLEHSYGSDFQPKVPVGVYKCVRRFSPRFKQDVFMLTDVPGCDFIEIHTGNFLEDSHGCILLGLHKSLNKDGVKILLMSKDAFQYFMKMQDGLNEFLLTVQVA
jgi:hypothetical protein